MALEISRIDSVGSIPPPVLNHFQNNVQNQNAGAVPPVNGIGTFNPPPGFQPAPNVGGTFGGNVGNTGNAQGQGSLTDMLDFNKQPTHTFAMWGQEFFFNPQFQAKTEAVDANGVNAVKATHDGVKAHEDAHYETAQRYGIKTGPPVVEMEGGMTSGGHVSLQTEEFNQARALKEGKPYVDDFKYRMGEGLIESAIAPEKAGLSHGYGELSGMDGDLGVKLLGEQNLAKVAAFEATNQGQALTAVKEKPSKAAQQQLAMLASHPDLLQAFQNGTIS
ncbi:MAG: hypothetical protein ACK551_03210 [Vampirovibrionales bacterium]